MLALFDIDGTLLQLPCRINQLAIEQASRSTFGVEVKGPDTSSGALKGLTTPMLGRLMLRNQGVPEDRIDDSWPFWKEAMINSYLELQLTTRDQYPFPDAGKALNMCLHQGWRVGLLTGNYRRVAKAKLRVAGIWHPQFDLNQGAFGDDAADRDELGSVALARAREAGLDRNVVVVGDTPRDISCARVIGCRAIAITTGGFSKGDLSGADAVVDSISQAAEHLLAWSSVEE
jgi:phosphoglycolate phosphatase